MDRKIILYIAMSVDGYIAGPDDDLSFLKLAEAEGEDYGYASFRDTVDTVICGRRTYDWVVREVGEFPEKERQVFVLSRTPRPALGNVTFYSGDILSLIRDLRSKPGKHIHLDGGGQVVFEFLRLGLADELFLFVIPILLGDGTRLFAGGRQPQEMILGDVLTYPTGVVRLHYQAARS